MSRSWLASVPVLPPGPEDIARLDTPGWFPAARVGGKVSQQDQGLLLSSVGCFTLLFTSSNWSSNPAWRIYTGSLTFQSLCFFLRGTATLMSRGVVVRTQPGTQYMAAIGLFVLCEPLLIWVTLDESGPWSEVSHWECHLATQSSA